MVDIDSNENVSLFESGSMLEDLKELLKVDIDLVSEDGLSWRIRPFIELENPPYPYSMKQKGSMSKLIGRVLKVSEIA